MDPNEALTTAQVHEVVGAVRRSDPAASPSTEALLAAIDSAVDRAFVVALQDVMTFAMAAAGHANPTARPEWLEELRQLLAQRSVVLAAAHREAAAATSSAAGRS